MNTKKKKNNTRIIANDPMQQELDNLPDIVCEKEDIICSMKEEAEVSKNWINDGILRRYIKKSGDKRLSVRTRKLIKVKSCVTYINYSKDLHKKLRKQVKLLLSEVQEK